VVVLGRPELVQTVAASCDHPVALGRHSSELWEVVDLSLQVEQQRLGHGLLGDCEPLPAHGEG
jgi:hypothetical protein